MKVWPLAAAAVLGGLALGVFLTRGPDPDAVPTTDEVAGRMMSPFCPGLTLEECPSDQSNRLRSEIDAMVREGSTNEQIDRWIVDNFGRVALARPQGSLAWVAPPVLALAGLGAVLLVLRRKPRGTEQTTPELSSEDERLFEKDFGNFRRGSE
ncbi:MAG TPA: cytochrome c-type biogenesis protein CcmH [Actinomycetota bacterium]|nr:cytochrome c-type biogenesis protein CcmH [Actinomycetota bacterium]